MKKPPVFFLLLFGCVFSSTISSSAQSNYEPYTFTTFVGIASSADGLGTAARFHGPDGVATDSAGNIYVADASNHTIRKITPDGYVATFVGSAGDYGSTDGVGSSARFAWPEGVTVGGMGNLYVCGESHTIRKITPAGVVSTLAGSGSQGSADGIGSAAQFNYPYALAADNAENIYVADTYNSTIRKVDPSGLVTTLAGSAGITGSADGPGNVARFNYPYGIAVDGGGNLYVADTNNYTIRKIDSVGVVSTFAGLAGQWGTADGVGTAARFHYPERVAIDSGDNLYVTDSSYTIRKITPAGVVSTFAGLAGTSGAVDGTGSDARFVGPRGINVDGTGNLYVVDGNTIRKITPDRVVTTIAGYTGLGLAGPDGTGTRDGTGSAARLDIPTGVAVDSKRNLYVHDGRGDGLRKVTPAAVVSTLASIEGAYYLRSYNVALDNAGNVVVGTYGSIQRVGPCGAVTTIPGGQGLHVSGLTIDDTGNIYVTINQAIQKITPSGVVSTFAGLTGSSGSADGTGSAARFSSPTGLALDSSGNFYVADSGNNTIRKITPAGAVTTLAGLAGNSGSTDGTGNVARFSGPGGVAVDDSGNIYVTDFGNNTIRKVTPAGVVTTLAGAPGSNHDFDSVDGTGSVARFFWPLGIAVDNTGNVYVVEYWNGLIRVGRPPNPARQPLRPGSKCGAVRSDLQSRHHQLHHQCAKFECEHQCDRDSSRCRLNGDNQWEFGDFWRSVWANRTRPGEQFHNGRRRFGGGDKALYDTDQSRFACQ